MCVRQQLNEKRHEFESEQGHMGKSGGSKEKGENEVIIYLKMIKKRSLI